MKTSSYKFMAGVLAITAILVLPTTASADQAYDALRAQVQLLTKQLQQVQATLKKYEKASTKKEEAADTKKDQLAAIKKDVAAARKEASAALQKEMAVARKEIAVVRKASSAAAEWKFPNSLIHIAGYADVNYTDRENANGFFNVGTFSPIFHFQYRDLVLLESELEFEVGPDGETEVGLEYLTIDLILNDYMVLVAGKFLSPVGQFRQNLHPSWINKLPSAAPGFGHDGAAPVSELGLQVRGGFPLRETMRVNYALYVGNGPELNSVTEDGIEFELEGIVAEAFGRDSDGSKVVGGRIGFLPIPQLEIGASAATGKTEVTTLVNEMAGTTVSLTREDDRDYDVYGADFVAQYKGFEVRGEFVKSKIGAANVGMTASLGAVWQTWYIQASRRLLSDKFEIVGRYTDFDSPHAAEDQKQWMVGVNYLHTPTVIAKLAYEFNDGQTGSLSDDDRFLAQLAYGF